VTDPVAEAIASARAAWPGVEVAPARFRAFLAGRGEPAALHLADLYLACACADGDPAAIAAFDRTHQAMIDRAVAATGATRAERADVAQTVRQRLLVAPEAGEPRIASYSGRGALGAWVRVVATREAARLLRRERREVAADDAELDGVVATAADPELDYLKRLYRDELKAAFRAAVDALSDRERMLLRQHVLDGLGIDRLAAFYRVHRATAARWVEAARHAVVTGTRKALVHRLRLAGGELDSVIRLVRSQLDLSLHAVLGPSS
jgi:RNA polymerase sigma-70 factor (ECF subfamily)